MKLKKYFEFTAVGFRTSLAYRLDSLASFANSIIFLALMYALWSAIAASGSLEGGLGRVLSYIVLGQVISSSIFMNVEKMLSGKIREGTIVNELKRPISLRVQVYFQMLGIMLFNFIFVGLPMLILGFLYLGLDFPGPLRLATFFLSMFLGYNIIYSLSYITSMFIFWTKVGWSIRMMRTTVQRLFSGVYFPLYLLPASLEPVFNLFPFQSMVDAPISIFMATSNSPVILIIAKQAIWIVVLLFIGEIAWLKAKKKITIQGG
ncbi:MAG: ABC-2 family transporter protein [Candidatus Nanohaloarchaea archaeon]